jgi:hypothetical protein
MIGLIGLKGEIIFLYKFVFFLHNLLDLMYVQFVVAIEFHNG